MKKINDFNIQFTSNEISEQVKEFFEYYQKTETASHSLAVATEAKRLAKEFGESEEKAFIAGLLHDISVVIPNEDRVALQLYLKEELLVEERKLPMILHQKQSVFIAQEIFGIYDEEILSAIESHTTLREDASNLDKLIFIADKIKWDRHYSAPYLEKLDKALKISLDEACRVYIDWALTDIIVLHPWLKAAMKDLEMNS